MFYAYDTGSEFREKTGGALSRCALLQSIECRKRLRMSFSGARRVCRMRRFVNEKTHH